MTQHSAMLKTAMLNSYQTPYLNKQNKVTKMTRVPMQDSNEAQSLIGVTLTRDSKYFPVQRQACKLNDSLKDTYMTIQPDRNLKSQMP